MKGGDLADLCYGASRGASFGFALRREGSPP